MRVPKRRLEALGAILDAMGGGHGVSGGGRFGEFVGPRAPDFAVHKRLRGRAIGEFVD